MGKLGELYNPTGLALETARQVLEVSHPMAVNVALGCGQCKYCYGPKAFFKKDWSVVRQPSMPPVDLVRAQMQKGLKPDGVFLSFGTDPLRAENARSTLALTKYLATMEIPTATLSKAGGMFNSTEVRTGMTIVSIDENFRKEWEPGGLPISTRIHILKSQHLEGSITWVSMEPFPTPLIWCEDIIKVLDAINFVDFIVLGKWNYSPLSSGEPARIYYEAVVNKFQDYCKSHGIRHHVKSDTLKFIGGKGDGQD